ncbi:MAG: type II toxin-antitoxin system VapC family toxin [Dehalococcoidia bacterium]
MGPLTTIVDAGPIVGVATTAGPVALRIREMLRAAPGPLIVPAPVTAEVDYLLTKQAGSATARRFLEDVAFGRFEVACLDAPEYATILELGARYADLDPGLADLSVIVLAHRFQTKRVLTIDQRHFRAMTAMDGQPFTLLPYDA